MSYNMNTEMAQMLDQREFDNLDLNIKEEKLDKYLLTRHAIAQLTNNEQSQKHFSVLLKLQPELVTKFGKFLVVNIKEKKIKACCDDLPSALDTIHKLHDKESFVFELPNII